MQLQPSQLSIYEDSLRELSSVVVGCLQVTGNFHEQHFFPFQKHRQGMEQQQRPPCTWGKLVHEQGAGSGE
jgi:hypothetical protein